MARCMQCGKELTHNEIGATVNLSTAAQNSFLQAVSF